VIRYHGLPMTPVDAMLRALKNHHALVSFEHPHQIAEAATVCQSVVLDNGTFSAWKAGRKHDFAGYLAWAKLWLRHPAVDWCVIPDVIDGDEQTNDELLEAWPLGPFQSVPVYHMHESIDRLVRLAALYPRVALGSSGQWANPGTDDWWERMDEMMEAICDEEGIPVCKLHGLRMLRQSIVENLPLASGDSCNAALNVGFDSRWTGSYAPKSKTTRAVVLIDCIESYVPAARWVKAGWRAERRTPEQHALELLG
jgi:hypothetical protein